MLGSIIRGEATERSDVDFMVTFEPDQSLLDLIGFKQDLEDLLGRNVDVVSEGAVNPYLRDKILKETQPL